MVYEKSELGHIEFVNEKRTLHFKERQVLLLINGVRKTEDLEQFFKKELLEDIIQKLELNGYIQRPSDCLTEKKTSIITPSFLFQNSLTAPINSIQIEAIKTILVDATNDYLGLMGHSIKTRIQACEHEVDLRSCISSWHMAMRESKLGRESTSFLMDQIHQTLENKVLDQNNHIF
ncbi:MAG: hypothetical protein Q8M99_10865 [Methylotenera sp.]|nr:hypothetical protein [Methylotenera sp.]